MTQRPFEPELDYASVGSQPFRPPLPLPENMLESTLEILVNDRPMQVAAAASLADVLHELGMQKPYIAVAINDTIIPRGEHATRRLQPHDRLVIVQAVGGG